MVSRCFFTRVHLLALTLAVLACSSNERDSDPERSAASEEVAQASPPGKRPSFDQRAPQVGDPAPPIALATLAGEQVTLPGSAADRAAILIFGSFS